MPAIPYFCELLHPEKDTVKEIKLKRISLHRSFSSHFKVIVYKPETILFFTLTTLHVFLRVELYNIIQSSFKLLKMSFLPESVKRCDYARSSVSVKD